MYVHLQRRLHSQENNVQRGWTGEEAEVGEVFSGNLKNSSFSPNINKHTIKNPDYWILPVGFY